MQFLPARGPAGRIPAERPWRTLLGCLTNLVSEPYLDKRTAALLSNLTDRNHWVVDGLSLIQQLAAVYFEEELLTETESFHGQQTAGSKKVEKVVEVM